MRDKSWFKKSDALAAAFLVPVVIMIIIFIRRDIFPFGDRSFLRTDMYHQYAPFFSEFREKLVNGGSLLSTWNLGLGINFSAIYAYYLASPLNWAIALVPGEYVIEFMTYMIVLKTGLAGLTMGIYLCRHSERSGFAPALFSVFYALSGYMAAYNWNIMWLDCIVLFPVICLGAEKLINEKKGILYVTSLGLCILSNYYISIMICIFMVLFLIMKLAERGKTSFKEFLLSAGQFTLYSLIAGALAGVLIIPVYFALRNTAAGELHFPQFTTQYFSIIDMLARHMPCVQTEQVLDHWPNIFCGTGVYVLTVMYILNREISLKEKIIYCASVFLLLSSFSINVLNFLWHGLHYPNSLPARQSFIYIFLLLYMGFRTVDRMEGNTVKHIAVAFLTSVGFILLCQKVVTDDAFTWVSFYCALGATGLYTLFIYLFRTEKINVNVLTFILLLMVAAEATVNLNTTGVPVISRDPYVRDRDEVRECIRALEEAEPGEFARYEKLDRRTKDDGAWYNFRSASVFSSTADADMSAFYKRMGCEAATNAYSITGSTPLVDAMLDIGYAIGKADDPDDTLTRRAWKGDTVIYRRKYDLPLGYMIDSDLEANWTAEEGDPAAVQNDLCRLYGTGDVLIPVDGFMEGNTFTVTTPEKGLYYAFSTVPQTEEITITIGDTSRKFTNLDRGYFMELGIIDKNVIVDADTTDGSPANVKIYRFDYDALGSLTEAMGSQPMTVDSFSDTEVNAHVNVTGRGILFMSIPYDEGWKLTVDGTERSVRSLFGNAFTGVDLGEGYHEIRLTYYPVGLHEGKLISMGAVLLLIVLCIIRVIIEIRKKKEAPDENNKEGGSDTDGDDPGSGPTAADTDEFFDDTEYIFEEDESSVVLGSVPGITDRSEEGQPDGSGEQRGENTHSGKRGKGEIHRK